jgi:hypothetical protein
MLAMDFLGPSAMALRRPTSPLAADWPRASHFLIILRFGSRGRLHGRPRNRVQRRQGSYSDAALCASIIAVRCVWLVLRGLPRVRPSAQAFSNRVRSTRTSRSIAALAASSS